MIQRIEHLPSNVVGFRASGRVTEQDYHSVIVPAVDRVVGRRGRVRLLYQLAPDFEGFDPHTSWSDPRIGPRHRTPWSRIALVTDLPWLRRAAGALGFTIPSEVRVFENRAFDQARDWVSA